MQTDSFQEDQLRLAGFFASDQPFVEFTLKCTLEERIDYVCRMLRPWLTGARLNLNFSIAKVAEIVPLSSVKVAIYRTLGMKIGKGVFISPDVILDPHFPRLIVLEDYVVLGWGAKIFTHEMSTRKYRVGRVVVQKGSVVGAFSVIRAGVAVGERAQTCMNSYIYRDVPPNHSGKRSVPQ